MAVSMASGGALRRFSEERRRASPWEGGVSQDISQRTVRAEDGGITKAAVIFLYVLNNPFIFSTHGPRSRVVGLRVVSFTTVQTAFGIANLGLSMAWEYP